MRKLAKVNCSNCGKKFLKYYVYVRDNKKLGHGYYCSSKCQFEHRKTGEWLICNNNLCKKSFYKVKNQISNYNFCSRSCAAIVNNKRYPKWPKRYCAICQKEFKNRYSDYCSVKCGYTATSKYRLGKSKYTREQIISAVKSFYKEHERAPAKREVPEIVGCATNKFGSWTNAITAAGLEPNRSHDHRMYKRTRTKAIDGHVCDSVSEALIDNWLHKNGIEHEKNIKYPFSNHRADWVVLGDVLIEYFGLAKDSSRYDKAIKEKVSVCKKHHTILIAIYPSDLYPKMSLDKKLGLLIPAEKRFRKTVTQIRQSEIDFQDKKNWKVLHSLKDLM